MKYSSLNEISTWVRHVEFISSRMFSELKYLSIFLRWNLLLESSTIDYSKRCRGLLLACNLAPWAWLWNFYCSFNSLQAFSKSPSLTRVCNFDMLTFGCVKWAWGLCLHIHWHSVNGCIHVRGPCQSKARTQQYLDLVLGLLT